MLLPKQKDNLIPNGWDSFEPVGDTENLIPNSWDSFSPYRSGKNYVENWDFTSDELHWKESSLKVSIKDNTLVLYNDTDRVNTMANYSVSLASDNYIDVILRVKYKSTNGFSFDNFNDGEVDNKLFEPSVDWVVEETTGKIKNNTVVKIYNGGMRKGKPGIKTEIDWIQITPVDNQHLVVEKTPLGNGLTRIQTWGGNARRKLWIAKALPINKTYTSALLIKNKSKAFEIRPFNSSIYFNHNVGELFDDFDVSTGEITMSDGQMLIIANNTADNLDFIASDPIINEGDKPNLTILREDLGNGLTRIRTFGGQEESKLRFEKPFDNEDLTFSTYLENVGEEPLGIKSFDNKTEYYEPDFKGMVEQYGKG